ncbi:hypothetical protein JYK14_25975 [Siccirubricoccus sp. KC 17139]|uniref:Uncharacterized protein n=1 Tax=Siccirubricoccus soli TaxID=2899147 RepID=A0ABT1DCB8_9PROT|nr:hypothetical protein [Siccirubricoccus soli]MCO6419587.1 hypothetical protein [Siccirubricoccus soli]MCP2685722.1 hypothetical protein [Siccirubricoccus soli]
MRPATLPILRSSLQRRRPGFWTRLALTGNSDIRGMVLRMIATNSLAAFTPGVSGGGPVAGPGPVTGPGGVEPVRGVTPGAAIGGNGSQPQQRTLEAVPPPPSKPMPRGSLLDLRV